MVSGDSQQIEKVKSIVKNMLIDGESAQFTDLKYYKATNFACGFVNAKNKMGGYVGNTSSTLPARKWMISLETDFKAQTTKRAWRGLRGLAVSNPGLQTATFGQA